jgi:hypothetical protein
MMGVQHYSSRLQLVPEAVKSYASDENRVRDQLKEQDVGRSALWWLNQGWAWFGVRRLMRWQAAGGCGRVVAFPCTIAHHSTDSQCYYRSQHSNRDFLHL